MLGTFTLLVLPITTTHKRVTQHKHTHTPFNGPFSGTTKVSRYQKGKTNLDFAEARDSEWQWHQLGHMQICTSLQTDNHASTPPLSCLQAGCPSCRPKLQTVLVNAQNNLKELGNKHILLLYVSSFHRHPSQRSVALGTTSSDNFAHSSRVSE